MRCLGSHIREFGVRFTGSATSQVLGSWHGRERRQNACFRLQGMEIINRGPENDSWRAGWFWFGNITVCGTRCPEKQLPVLVSLKGLSVSLQLDVTIHQIIPQSSLVLTTCSSNYLLFIIVLLEFSKGRQCAEQRGKYHGE